MMDIALHMRQHATDTEFDKPKSITSRFICDTDTPQYALGAHAANENER